MKTFLIGLLFISSLKAEVFTWANEKKSVQKIQIEILNGMKVNSTCFKEKIACLKILDSIQKTHIELKIEKGPLGNPASAYCESHNGQPEILRDAKNNEYDFCLLDKKYLVDSWDLMK